MQPRATAFRIQATPPRPDTWCQDPEHLAFTLNWMLGALEPDNKHLPLNWMLGGLGHNSCGFATAAAPIKAMHTTTIDSGPLWSIGNSKKCLCRRLSEPDCMCMVSAPVDAMEPVNVTVVRGIICILVELHSIPARMEHSPHGHITTSRI